MTTTNETIWKKRFDALKNAIGSLDDSIQDEIEKPVPKECWSAASEFFISNDLQICDNEKYAKDHWGKGKYFRVVKS